METDDVKISFVGIGAQKAATTWIFKCLQEHPEIYVFEGKEIHFFSDNKKFSRGKDWYYSFFKKGNSKKVIGEISTTYLSSPEAPQRIKDTLGNIKIVVSLRNPVERSYSHYLHKISTGLLSQNNRIYEAVKKFPDIIENSMYGKLIEKYFNAFPRENILILFFEDIKSDPELTIKKLYRFLEVNDSFRPRGINKKYHTTAARLSSYYKIFKLISRLHIKLKKNLLGRLLIKILRKLGINSYRMYALMDRKGKSNNKIAKEDWKFLQGYFRQDVKNLEKLLNKNLSNWLQ